MIRDDVKEQFEKWYTRRMKLLTTGIKSALLTLPTVKRHMYKAYEQGYIAGMYYQYKLAKEQSDKAREGDKCSLCQGNHLYQRKEVY